MSQTTSEAKSKRDVHRSRYWPIVGLWFEPLETGVRLRTVRGTAFAALIFAFDLIVLIVPLSLILSGVYREIEYSRTGHTGLVSVSLWPFCAMLAAAIATVIGTLDFFQRPLGGVGTIRSIFEALAYGLLPAATWACIAAAALKVMQVQNARYLDRSPQVRMILEDMPMGGSLWFFNFLMFWAPLFAITGLVWTAVATTQLLRGVTGLRTSAALAMLGTAALLALAVVVLSFRFTVIPIDR
jgi:hypothetical protein